MGKDLKNKNSFQKVGISPLEGIRYDLKTIEELKIYGERYGRKFLAPIIKYASFPDLLDAQKKGYREFVEYYLNLLFEEISPIEDIKDITGGRFVLEISDVRVSLPDVDEETCKKRELTYG